MSNGYSKKILTARLGNKISIYFKDNVEICGYCLKLRHEFRNCGAKSQGVARSSCSKCNRYGHPVEICNLITRPSVNTLTEAGGENKANMANDQETEQDSDSDSEGICALDWTTSTNNVNTNKCKDPINIFSLYNRRHPVTMRIRVKNTYTKVIADTGASLSVANTGFIAAIIKDYKSKLIPYNGPKVMAASGNTLQIVGYIDVSCHLNNSTVNIRVLVADNLPHCMLWGVKELEELDANISFNTKTIKFNKINEEIPFSIYHLPSAAGELVDTINIPAEHATVAWINAPSETIGKNREWVVEPVDKTNPNIVIAYTVTQDRNNSGRVPVQILNLSEKEVELKAGLSIAKFFPLSEISKHESASKNTTVTDQIDNIIKTTNLINDKQQ